MAIKPGDTVSLKSGGPRMTVRKLDNVNHLVDCDWFDHENELKRASFVADQLEVHDGDMPAGILG